MNMEEIWEDIDGYIGMYQVSNLGQVRSLDRIENWMGFGRPRVGRIMKNRMDRYGYATVILSKDSKAKHFTVHRLVATHFLSNPNSFPQINHKDGIKTNNSPENLEYCDASTNVQHSWDTGLSKKQIGVSHHHSTPVIAIKETAILEFECLRECADYIGVSITSVWGAAKRGGKSGGFLIYYA
jgi:hypothetical protein